MVKGPISWLIEMMDVDVNNSLHRSAGGYFPVGFRNTDQVAHSAISTRGLIEPIFLKTFYMGVTVPFIFAYLGSSNALASFDAQARWLVGAMGWIWPVLP